MLILIGRGKNGVIVTVQLVKTKGMGEWILLIN